MTNEGPKDWGKEGEGTSSAERKKNGGWLNGDDLRLKRSEGEARGTGVAKVAPFV